MDFEPTLSPAFISYIRSYLADYKVDFAPILANNGIEADDNNEFEIPIPLSKITALIESARKITKNDYVGVQMGRQFHYENSGLIILITLAASSVEHGLKTLCQYDKYVDTAIESEFEVGSSVSVFSAKLLNPKNSKIDQLNEYLMAFIVQALTTATRKSVPIREVWFQHGNDRDGQTLKQFFKSTIKYNQATNGIVFDSSFLKERFFTSNKLLFGILKNALKTYHIAPGEIHGFKDAVCREIIRLALDDSPSIETVAASMSISARTLRRRLKEEGVSFQEVKNLAREQRAQYYLTSTKMPLSEVAYELGFSELSAFSRAFRGWTGESPQIYRDNSRKLMRIQHL